MDKSTFKGTIISIQPRIRLIRSFDEASHTYRGYTITLEGERDKTNTTFSIGKVAYVKHQFKVNDIISLGNRSNTSSPWELVPLELEVYRVKEIIRRP